jgi:plasmid stabilization system protein ParE
VIDIRIPEWRPKAWEDVEGHAVTVGSAGEKFLDCVRETVGMLCEHPELGGVFETTNPRLIGIRAKLVNDFRQHVVFYHPHATAIEVVRVLGGGQDMHSLIDAES